MSNIKGLQIMLLIYVFFFGSSLSGQHIKKDVGIKVLFDGKSTDNWRSSGHIALQDQGNDVWFRDIKIRVLPQRR